MVNIKDGCGCDPCACTWKQKLEEAYARASVSINKITDQQGSVYYPDGSGNVQIPIPTSAQIAGIGTMTEKLAALETGLKDETAERKAKDSEISGDLANADMRITANADDITAMKGDVATVKGDMKTLSDNEVAQNADISALKAQATGITESLVSDVNILDGATTGNIKIRIDRKSAASIDSDDYNIGRPVSAEIIQGTGPSMFKIQVTLSSGQVITSNDFVFTTEAIGTDIYISSFTFKAGTEAGYISADIGLNNGVTIQANDFLIPTDPNVTTNISGLQTRMTTAESNIVNNTTEISDLKTSKVSVDQGTVNAGKVLGINTLGQVEPVEGGSGGEVWEEVDLKNFPADWVAGDVVKVQINRRTRLSTAPSSWTSTIDSSKLTYYEGEVYKSDIVQLILSDSPQETFIPVRLVPATNVIYLDVIANLNTVSYWNDLTVTTRELFIPNSVTFNGSSMAQAKLWAPSRNNNFEGIYKMWRLKK